MNGRMAMLAMIQFYPLVPSMALPDLLLFTFSITVSLQHNIINLSFTHLKKQSSQIFFTKYFTLSSPAKQWSWLTYPSEFGKGNVTGGSVCSFQWVLSRTVHHCLELFIRKVSMSALDTSPHECSLESKSQPVLEHLPKILNSGSFSSTLFTFLQARELMSALLNFLVWCDLEELWWSSCFATLPVAPMCIICLRIKFSHSVVWDCIHQASIEV